jgi:hypothetical protein
MSPRTLQAAILDRVHFIPLPPPTWDFSRAQLRKIR